MELKPVFIAIIMLIAILAIIISLLILLNLALKKNKTLTAQLQILSSNNHQNEMIINLLTNLGGDINSMYINTDIINQLPLDTIKNYRLNLFMYNYHRMREYDGRFIGQYIDGYFKDIINEEKRNYFYSVLESALLNQPINRLMGIFINDLKEEIIVEEFIYNNLAEPRKIFRDWFFELMTRKENFEKLGQNILRGICNGLSRLLLKENVSQEQTKDLTTWISKINQLSETTKENLKINLTI